jgi:hypothetical protein
MAKALLGHVGMIDPTVTSELRRLRRRIADLESQMLRLQVENDALAAAAASAPQLLILEDSSPKEPVLA